MSLFGLSNKKAFTIHQGASVQLCRAYPIHRRSLLGKCRCRYPVDWVLPQTSMRIRQATERVTTGHHMFISSGSCLSDEVFSGDVTCSMASDPASMSRRALAPPRVLQLRTPFPHRGGLRHCHVSQGSGPRLPAGEGSGAATYPMVPDLTSP
jgi:hypothetical protein